MNLVHDSIPFELDDVLQRQIEFILLNEPNIADYAVLLRRADDLADEIIIYLVPQGPVNQAELQARLEALSGQSRPVIRFVPLFKLPLTPDGLTDYRALTAIPVLDDAFLEQSEHRLRTQNGIKNAAIIRLQRLPGDESRYHLDDLLPDAPHESHPASVQTGPSPEAGAANGTHQPALVDGGVLNASEAVRHATLLDLLRSAAFESGNRFIRFIAGDGTLTEWRYADLWQCAERVYAGLLASGLTAGDKVILQLHGIPDILAAFWACQMGGFIPVIVEVPRLFQPGNQAFERVAGLLQLLQNPLIVADEAAASDYAKADGLPVGWALRMSRIEELKQFSPEHQVHPSQPDDIAFFNLSSGSTGIPKCIMLTHRNLLARAYGTNQLCGYADTDVILNWLPFDHIGSISDWHIRCVLLGCELIYVDKDYVSGDLINWLNLIDRFRVSHSWAPNFAFTLINKQLEAAPPPAWDLACVKGLLTAGEAVSDSAVQGFIRALAKFGLKRTAVQPAFGMAELGSGITYFVPGETNPLRFHTVLKPAMGRPVERVDEEHPAATHFADLGPPIPGVSLRIVDNDGTLLPMETVGRLQIRGDVVFQGYFDNPAANAAAFQADGWFNTGDLGFLSQGNLVLSGREKETIIIKGANYYSHEVEETATQVAGVEPSFTAACGVRRSRDKEEKLALFFVPQRSANETDVIRAMRTQVANRYGISPTYLVPLEQQQIPKTAIGKIQRTQLKQRLEAGEFDGIIKRIDLILGNANTLPSWFYRSAWIAKQVKSAEPRALSGTVLIVLDGSGLGHALSNRLQATGQACVTVMPGTRFEHKDNIHYEIDFESKADVLALFRQFGEHQIVISEIVSLIDYEAVANHADAVQQGKSRYPNVAALLHLVQAAAETNSIARLQRILWVASDCHSVTPDEPGSAEKAMMIGFIQALRLEYPAVECVHIDLPSARHADNTDLLSAELNTFAKEPSVAYRNGQRYVLRLRHLDLLNERRPPFNLKKGGTYLVSGGLGGLGFELCRRLGRDSQARLLILGRSPLKAEHPEQASTDASQPLLQRYQALLDEQIDCTYAQVDIGDQAAVFAQVKQAEMKWGQALDGIFHLAGVAYERPLSEESVESFTNLARPKCEGIIVLGELVKARKGTFLVAFSSLNATFGGSNISSISAANAFLDAYSRQLYRSGLPALCYDWSLWDGLGMSANSATKSIAAAKGFYPITFEEGYHSLCALLNAGQPEALIGLDGSKAPIRLLSADSSYEQQTLTGFIELRDSTAKESLPKTLALQDRFGATLNCPMATLEALPLTEDGNVDKNRLAALASQDGQTKKAPTNPVETALVEVWRDLLQITDIGTQDNFFELGGDSLLTVQLVALIAKTFKQQIPASTIFHAPTVEQLAKILDENASTPDFFSLVPIKPSGTKPPLFIIQTNCRVLVSFLDADQPAYALNYGVGAKTTESMLNIPESVEDLALHYVREIRLFQPQGPYFLLGHCAGGLVAYEVAQQLAAQHQTVGMLGMIDTFYLPDKLKTPSLSLLDKLFILPKLSLTFIATIIRKRIDTLARKVKGLFIKDVSITKTLFIRSKHLYPSYLPKPYPGKISYFKCTKQAQLQPDGNYEDTWKELAQEEFRMHLIPCHHDEILSEPHAKMLAAKITQDLNGFEL